MTEDTPIGDTIVNADIQKVGREAYIDGDAKVFSAFGGAGRTEDRAEALAEAIMDVIGAEADKAPLSTATIIGVLTIVQHDIIMEQRQAD